MREDDLRGFLRLAEADLRESDQDDSEHASEARREAERAYRRLSSRLRRKINNEKRKKHD